MKIYVVTNGKGGEYHICAVTTDKDNAEYLRQLCCTDKHNGNARIEVFDDYAGLKPIKGKLYKVFCFYNNAGNIDGLLACREEFPYGNSLDEAIRFEEEGFHGTISHKKLSDDCDGYVCLVVAESKEKAEKIGIDMIQEYRAKEICL